MSDFNIEFEENDMQITLDFQGGGSIGGKGLTEDVKQALLQIAEKVAYIDDDGQDYYDALYDALYAVTAISINVQSIMLTSIGSTQQLTATTTPAGGAVTWASSNTSIATVSNTGLVTSVGYGSCTITASSGSVSASCAVAVSQVTLTSISAVYQQSGTVYDTDTLNSLKSDLTVTATYSDSSTATVTEYTLSGTLTAGTSTITVSYGGKTTTFNVTVTAAPTLTSISAIYTQSGTVYDTDSLDSLKSDLVVTAHYSDQTTETVTTYTLSGTLTAGTSTITVSYSGKTTTFTVTVTAAPTLSSISAVYTQSGTVYETDSLDSLKSDLVVTAIYSDSSTETVTTYTLSGTLTVGTSTITVSYSGKTTAINVTVSSDADEPIIISDRTYTPGYIDDSGNIKSLSNNYVNNMYIPITGNIIVDFTKTRSSVTTCRVAEYDSSQGFIKRSYVSATNRGGASGFILDSNTAYVRVGFVTTAPESVFENFEVMRNTGISNYLYYESGSIDASGNETTSSTRVRSGYISLSNNTSAFAVLYSSISNTTAQLKLYNSSKVYSGQAPSSAGSYYENTGTEYPFARLIYGISSGTLGNVDDSAIVIDGTIYRLKAGDIS